MTAAAQIERSRPARDDNTIGVVLYLQERGLAPRGRPMALATAESVGADAGRSRFLGPRFPLPWGVVDLDGDGADPWYRLPKLVFLQPENKPHRNARLPPLRWALFLLHPQWKTLPRSRVYLGDYRVYRRVQLPAWQMGAPVTQARYDASPSKFWS